MCNCRASEIQLYAWLFSVFFVRTCIPESEFARIDCPIQVVWGGLSPDLLADISSYPDLCKEAQRVLDSMYSALLPRKVHMQDLVNKEILFYNNGLSAFAKR